MEVSVHQFFNRLPSEGESKFLFPFSVFPSCAYKGCYTGFSPYKQTFLRNTNHLTPNSSLCISRKSVGISWQNYVPKKVLGWPYSDSKMCIHDNFHRCIVVRSELAKTGTSDAAYPLAELQLSPKIKGICFYAITSMTAIFLFALMVVAHPFVLLLDQYRRKFHHLIAKIWATLTVSPFYKIEFEGLENLPTPDTPAVYVSNHQSFLDIYTLLTLGRSFKFISKTAIFLFPVVGWAMFMLGIIPLKRLDGRSQLDCLKQCIDLVEKGASVFFFFLRELGVKMEN